MQPHCHEILFAPDGLPFIITLFVGALVGSLTHCIGMCGPFVLAQASGFSVPEGKQPQQWYRQLLLPYHLGRLTTYTLLGVAAAALSASVLRQPLWHIFSSLLLSIAGMLFLMSAFAQIFPLKYANIRWNVCAAPDWLMRIVAKYMPGRSLWSGYLTGLLLGVLPCGLVYAAVIASAATGNVAEAAAGMVAFAAGTMPVLMMTGLSGKFLLKKQYSWIKPASAILMAFNSIVLFAMAGRGFI